MRKHDEFWKPGGGRKMRHHDAPAIARQAAAHMQRNFNPDSTDWMRGRAAPEQAPADNLMGAAASGPANAVQPMSPGQMQLD